MNDGQELNVLLLKDFIANVLISMIRSRKDTAVRLFVMAQQSSQVMM